MSAIEFHDQAEAETAFRAAQDQAWGTGRRVSLKIDKVCGTPAIWWLVTQPPAVVGPDLSCERCGMSAHPQQVPRNIHPHQHTLGA